MAWFASFATVATVGVAPASAAGATFEGKSSQGRPVTLTADDNGAAQSFNFAWRAPCRRRGFRFTSDTRSRPPWQVTADGFISSGGYTMSLPRGLRARVSGVARGRHVLPNEWAGSFKLSVVVRRRGRVIDRCHLRSTDWQAYLVSG